MKMCRLSGQWMGRCLKKFAKIAKLPRTFDEQSFYSIVYEGAANSTAGRLCDLMGLKDELRSDQNLG